MARARVADALTPHLALQRDGGEAMHRQLYSTFRTAILDGVFAPGTRLPVHARARGRSRRVAHHGAAGVRATRERGVRDRALGRGDARRDESQYQRASALDDSRGAQRPARTGSSAASLALGDAVLDEFKIPRPAFQMVPFALGVPALDEFPVALWSRLIGRLWRTRASSCSASPTCAAIRRCARRSRST